MGKLLTFTVLGALITSPNDKVSVRERNTPGSRKCSLTDSGSSPAPLRAIVLSEVSEKLTLVYTHNKDNPCAIALKHPATKASVIPAFPSGESVCPSSGGRREQMNNERQSN